MPYSAVLQSRPAGRALEIAARSIFESRALSGTVDDLVSLRALDHHWRGLFQYAAIRVGTKRAGALLTQLAASVDAGVIPSCRQEDTGSRPFLLYHQLRALCLTTHGAEARPNDAAAAPRFWSAPDPAYAKKLERLRRSLDESQAEVAELHFARALELADVAPVMSISVESAEVLRQEALAIARTTCGERGVLLHDRAACAALREAFSLDPYLAPTPPQRNRTPMLRCGSVIARRYEIEAMLGSGAFADVYRARDRDVEGHTVALKVSRTLCLDDRSVQIAMRELQLLASVFHPSVVQLKDHGWHEGHLWFVMPLYRGETLAARLRRGALTRAEARAIFVPLAEALATMHRTGVLHQDIKPDNIFLADIDPADDGSACALANGGQRQPVLPVLLDLGLAARDAEIVLAGTPAYLAPEVAARFAGMPDPAPVGPKADVFALALTLRDALEPDTDSGPPLASVDAFLEYRATNAPSPPGGRAMADLRGLFTRLLHVSPDRRPTSAELCRQLAQLTAPQERAARRAATLRWAVPTAVALFCLFGLVVYGLSQEAAIQRIEAANARFTAARARQRVASINADLAVQQARRRELEAHMTRLEQNYQKSRLTRKELASRLAYAEGELRAFADRVSRQQRRLSATQQELSKAQETHTELGQALQNEKHHASQVARQLERTRGQLQNERAKAGEFADERTRLEQRIIDLEAALEYSRTRLSRLRRARAPEFAASGHTDHPPSSSR